MGLAGGLGADGPPALSRGPLPRFLWHRAGEWRSGAGGAAQTYPDLRALAHDGPFFRQRMQAGPGWGWFGFSFDPSRPWPGFPAAMAVVPAQATASATAPPPLHRPSRATHGPAEDGGLDPDRCGWRAAFASVAAALHAGAVEKAVLARPHRLPPAEPFRLLQALVDVEPAAAHYLVQTDGTNALVGASPETLAHVRGDTLHTHALAGTQRRDGAAPPPGEHAAVVQDMVARLQDLGLRPRVAASRPMRLRHVEHTETRIEAELSSHGLLDIAAALHPTPATCGVPRDAAMRLLRTVEPAPRGWYGGGVGWMDADGEGHITVALRCALVTAQATEAWVGAGIVAGSDEELEWQETQAKLRGLAEAVARARAEGGT